MKNIKYIAAAGFAAVALMQGYALAQPNLLVNGDFNTGDLTGWWTYAADAPNQTAAIDNSYTLDSSPNLSLSSASSVWRLVGGQNPAIGSGVNYNLSLDYSATDTPSWGSAAVSITYYDALAAYVGYEWIVLYDQTAAPNADGEWLSYSGYFTTPANTASMQFELDVWNCTTFHADNVSLTVVPEPSALALAGLGGLLLLARTNAGKRPKLVS